MVVYEVNLRVDAVIAEAFEVWLATHIQEMLELDGFFRARWYERELEMEGLPAGDDAATIAWCVQYDVYTRQELDHYLRVEAPKMRGDGLSRFGGRFTATRRVLTARSLGHRPAAFTPSD